MTQTHIVLAKVEPKLLVELLGLPPIMEKVKKEVLVSAEILLLDQGILEAEEEAAGTAVEEAAGTVLLEKEAEAAVLVTYIHHQLLLTIHQAVYLIRLII